MAACTTTYFEAGRSWNARVAEHNAQLMARQPQLRRRMRTPEFYFARHIDNSRLVKAADPVRVREMRLFCAAICVSLFGDDLRNAALFRHRERLPRRAGEADAQPVARGKPGSCAWPRPSSPNPDALT